ncbi:eukaryotic translation initiation factor 2 subunit gamma [Balamuthia mandrillaris]
MLRLPEALCLSIMDTNPPYTSIENLSGGLLRVAVLKGTFERGGDIQVLPGRIIRNNTNHEEDDMETENECRYDYCYQPYSTRLANIFEANELDRNCSGEQYSSTGKEVAVKGGLALFNTTLDPSLYKNSSFYSFQRVASLHGTTVKVWVEIEVAFCYLNNMLPPGPSGTPVLRISNQRMKQGERILCRTGETAMNISILNICNSKNGQAMTLRGKPQMPLCAAVDDPIMFFLPFVRRLSNGLSRRWEPAAIGKVLASGVVCTLLPTT